MSVAIATFFQRVIGYARRSPSSRRRRLAIGSSEGIERM